MRLESVTASFGRLDDTVTAEELIVGSLQSIARYAESGDLTEERRKLYSGLLKNSVEYYLTRLEPEPGEG